MCSSSLDNLATNGIINFDADAFIKGTPPRYVGNPEGEELYLPLDKPLLEPQFHNIKGGEYLSGEPNGDAFISHRKPKKISLKQALIGVLAAGAAIFTGTKMLNWSKARKAAKAAKEAAKAAKAANAKGIFKNPNIVKGLKIGGGIAAGLIGLYAIYKGFFEPRIQQGYFIPQRYQHNKNQMQEHSQEQEQQQQPSPIVHR